MRLSLAFLEAHAAAPKSTPGETVALHNLPLFQGAADLLHQFDAWFSNVAVTPDPTSSPMFNQRKYYRIIDWEGWQRHLLHWPSEWVGLRHELDYCLLREGREMVVIFHKSNPYWASIHKDGQARNFGTMWPLFEALYDSNMIELIERRKTLGPTYAPKYRQKFDRELENELQGPSSESSMMPAFPNSYWEEDLSPEFIPTGEFLNCTLEQPFSSNVSSTDHLYATLLEHHQSKDQSDYDLMPPQRSLSPITPSFDEQDDLDKYADARTPSSPWQDQLSHEMSVCSWDSAWYTPASRWSESLGHLRASGSWNHTPDHSPEHSSFIPYPNSQDRACYTHRSLPYEQAMNSSTTNLGWHFVSVLPDEV